MANRQDLLKDLRAELELIRGSYGDCGLAIIRPSAAITLSGELWARLTNMRATYSDGNILSKKKMVGWADPPPDGTWCIRWWGDAQAVDSIKTWGDKVSGVLRRFPEMIARDSVGKGYYGTIDAFLFVTATSPFLSTLIASRVLLNNVAARKFLAQYGPVTRTGKPLQGPVAFEILDLTTDAMSFAAEIIELLIHSESHELSVDVDNEQVTVDGQPYKVSRLQAQIVDVLIAADGEIRSRTDMQKAKKELEPESHIERHIQNLKKTCPVVGRMIERVEGKGFRLNRQNANFPEDMSPHRQ